MLLAVGFVWFGFVRLLVVIAFSNTESPPTKPPPKPPAYLLAMLPLVAYLPHLIIY